ncbi:MAG: hypothetical protein QM626_05000 [Microbacterium sp.]|uniref:hypothetical protein n=1 Tax=Microbacterium sp. TaxID=51671 RepID=UPI0039E3240A
MSPRLLLLAVAALATVLTACAPDPETTASPTETITPSVTASASASASATATAVAVPTDCRAILSASVLSQLADTPLNDPDTGVSTGVQADGSLVCLWRDPAADTTYLQTTISQMSSGPALDMLNELVTDEGFTCYTPSSGTRCEKTWTDATYPVTDGRTLFYRDGIMIDTSYSNLAPSGYTDSIVASLFG